MSDKTQNGFKRLVASYLSVIVEVLRAVPGTGPAIIVLETIAGLFGITGIAHASMTGAITKKLLATASAAIAALTALTYFIPSLAPFRETLQEIAALLGSAAVGAQLSIKTADAPQKDIDKVVNKELAETLRSNRIDSY